jgi:hypothetical protein
MQRPSGLGGGCASPNATSLILTGHGPEGCDENGPAAALLVGHVST